MLKGTASPRHKRHAEELILKTEGPTPSAGQRRARSKPEQGNHVIRDLKKPTYSGMSNPSFASWVLLMWVLLTFRLVYFNWRHRQRPLEFTFLLFPSNLGICCKTGVLTSLKLLGLAAEVLKHQGVRPDLAAPKNARDVVAQHPGIGLPGNSSFWGLPP